MKDLLIKEHYCYRSHTLLMKSKAYPFCVVAPSPYMGYRPSQPPTFLKKSSYHFFDFSKISTPYN